MIPSQRCLVATIACIGATVALPWSANESPEESTSITIDGREIYKTTDYNVQQPSASATGFDGGPWQDCDFDDEDCSCLTLNGEQHVFCGWVDSSWAYGIQVERTGRTLPNKIMVKPGISIHDDEVTDKVNKTGLVEAGATSGPADNATIDVNPTTFNVSQEVADKFSAGDIDPSLYPNTPADTNVSSPDLAGEWGNETAPANGTSSSVTEDATNMVLQKRAGNEIIVHTQNPLRYALNLMSFSAAYTAGAIAIDRLKPITTKIQGPDVARGVANPQHWVQGISGTLTKSIKVVLKEVKENGKTKKITKVFYSGATFALRWDFAGVGSTSGEVGTHVNLLLQNAKNDKQKWGIYLDPNSPIIPDGSSSVDLYASVREELTNLVGYHWSGLGANFQETFTNGANHAAMAIYDFWYNMFYGSSHGDELKLAEREDE